MNEERKKKKLCIKQIKAAIQQIHLYQYFECARRTGKKRSMTYIRSYVCKQNFNSFNVFVHFQ